ncbi:MAG: hypothetical protein M1817_000584 [Caeruleum heppii]|nr:MAG: hypothetical protein M1817_000584 [Caeruleum heppii]
MEEAAADGVAQLEYSVDKPLNREPPLKDLVSSFITEQGAYDRNHGYASRKVVAMEDFWLTTNSPLPHLDVNTHRVRVDGAVTNILQLSAEQLQHDFPQHEVVCALQCAGNRRHTMRTLLKEVDGIDWGDGAVMNCRWRGPRLRDVLQKAGPTISDPSNAHVAFACFATPCQDDEWYGGSIRFERAMRDDADVILGLQMNGHTLPVKHGFPVRVIAPGIAGARSVKWLDRITVQTDESRNFYQQHDYKILPPEATDMEVAKKYWHTVPAIQDMPVNSVIAVPQSGESIHVAADGTVEVRGYALPQGDQGPVIRVEVSSDGGQTWSEAELIGERAAKSRWCWALWKASVCLRPGDRERILSRATDAGGNTQQATSQWNLRGVAYSGYGEARDLEVLP